ncbi:serine hydrolase domain-containing protein [Marinilabilia rubra]|uniref:serine hydrolase domain-containing protein n=1 Tax=Marinilabilia rubra TaxID=2162893 RepID=UPI001304F1D2|nr:serine hydrolase [Marinilabilia rubra]
MGFRYSPEDTLTISRQKNYDDAGQFYISNDSASLKPPHLILLNNSNETFPLKNLDQSNFQCLLQGDLPVFKNRLMDYLEMPVFTIPLDSIEEKILKLKSRETKTQLIVGLNASDSILGISPLIKKLMDKHSSVVVFFGKPETMTQWTGIADADGVLLSEKSDSVSQDLAAQSLFGGMGVHGTLQKEIPGMYAKGHGIASKGGLRFEYTHPDSLGLNGDRLNERIDSVVNNAIDQEAFPGCQILMAVNGKVILRKSYGYHTYDKRQKVQNSDLYDLASVTKISGPLPLLMQLNGSGVLDLDRPFSDYWADWKNGLFHCSNKDTLTLRQILAHQARLVPYLGFWRETKRDGRFKRNLYRLEASPDFPYQVDEHLYLKERFTKKIYRIIRRSDLLPDTEYRYSGLSFLVYPEMISQMTGTSYEELLYSEVYKPLGAARLVYNPLNKGFTKSDIPPTEVDLFYRESQVHGRVHDEAAAVFGGVSGNAGLFGNANDLAKLMQMYLNKGNYGGQQIIPRQVMDEFTRVQFPENQNRRGLGFDKPLLDNASKDLDDAYPAPGVSASSFGHSGFTGTFVWMDPEYKVLYVFLSNRVYPTRRNVALFELNVRTSIQQFLYDELSTSSYF